MKKPVFYIPHDTPALVFARKQLKSWGYPISEADATHWMFPVPTPKELLLQAPPEDVIVLGGNLPPLHCPSVDFLKDEHYLLENADITARCALEIAQPQNTDSILVIGWGRIAKALAEKYPVTVASRSGAPGTVSLADTDLHAYTIIMNTAPAYVLDQADAAPDATLIDLASVRGITGDRVNWARGLPGKMAPELSGALIAKTALRYALGKEHIL